MKLTSRGRFHRHSTSSFCASLFTLISQGYGKEGRVEYTRWVEYNAKDGHIFVGETECHQHLAPPICALREWVGEIDTRDQFHQHFTRSFYMCGSQKPKKTWIDYLFALLGSARVEMKLALVGSISPTFFAHVFYAFFHPNVFF